jgi:hypothetical protein
MEFWQKEIQTASLRSKELDSFNRFLARFVELSCERLVGKRFSISFPSSGGAWPWSEPEDDYVLEVSRQRPQAVPSEMLFNYVKPSSRWNRYCLKAYDHYVAIRDGKIRPVDPEVERDFLKTLKEEILNRELRFPDAEEWIRQAR